MYDRYERYKIATTLNEAIARGASLADIRWDYTRGFWWTVELPTLPEAVASESGGQESALEDSQPAAEPVVAADGAVRTSSDPIIASTAKAVEEIFTPWPGGVLRASFPTIWAPFPPRTQGEIWAQFGRRVRAVTKIAWQF